MIDRVGRWVREAQAAIGCPASSGILAARSGLLLLLGLTVLSGSCRSDTAFQEEKVFGPGGWAYADSAAYVFPVTDTTDRYDLVLTVDHTTDFPYQNFYVHLATYLPDGRVLQQPLSLQLADRYGEWYGACGGGECATDISIQEAARFDVLGEHRLVVRQYSREDPLAEVTGLGFRIVKR